MALRDRLVPIAQVITPNLPEAAVLIAGPTPATLTEMREAVQDLHRLGPDWVLLKGGHLLDQDSTDLRFDGRTITELSVPRIATRNTHGTGCTLSAAIAALLPRFDTVEAVWRAKAYLTAALAASELGRATVATLRLKLLKIGAAVKESWRRIVIDLPTSCPWKDVWLRTAVAVGAR